VSAAGSIRASSLTHEHLLAVLHTETGRYPPATTIRVLDAGCGNGRLLAYLSEAFPLLNGDVTLELYGFDIVGPGVQRGAFVQATVDALRQSQPSVPWAERVVGISADEPWPYPEEFFDVVLSNQVLEHVSDHDHFFDQVFRTLRWGGFSVHLFPLKHYIYEGHLHLPFVHRITDFQVLRNYIATLSVLGLGKYREHRKRTGITLARFAERHADYMNWFTNYLSYGEALRLGKRHGFRTSFKYTREFYTRKLKSLWSSKRGLTYRVERSSVLDWISVTLLRYVSGVTLFLEKAETYRRSSG
jgi:SAM-dependent methyltransferase